jgi:hypothetical protein
MDKKNLIFMFFFVLIWGLAVHASGKQIGESQTLYPKLTQIPPKLDGVLDDPAWQEGPIVTGPFILNHPVYGETLPQKTEVWLSYDHNNIYVAFYCYDTEPGKIKTTISRRDNLGNDDWVGVDLDTMGKRQFTYEHLCNPNGIQTDLINSASGGENSEPDWVWYSTGKIVKDGYIVEIRIPLKSIKFKSGDNVMMNLVFCRSVSRTGANASWPLIDEKKGYFNSLVPVVFEKLKPQLRLEALPTLTYGSIRDRLSPAEWSDPDRSTQFGIGIKYGITSSINTEITINPDFSQVESDQFQVEANQRYPIFYSEKRPFFMEIQNQFDLAGLVGSTNMSTAVHTRNIIAPAWGGKITGDLGKISAGFLAAGDEWEGDGKNANFLLGRLKYSIKGDSYIGLIYTGRDFGDDTNHVIGSDLRFTLKGNHNICFNGLYSNSNDPDTLEKTNGGAFTMTYENYRKPLSLFFFAEHYTRDFRMDSAYYYRTGITSLSANIAPNFYPKFSWLQKIKLQMSANYTHDLVTGMDDSSLVTLLGFTFPRQGYFSLSYKFQKEAWMGESFNQNRFSVKGQVQLTNWLYLYGSFDTGKLLYYSGPFLGNKISFYFQTQIQPGYKFTQDFEYQYEHFNRESDHQRIYNLNIFISRTTYQFNKYLFVKSLIQYDSYRQLILTDILASFTLIPGTVVHLGYGSLHRKRYWDETNSAWDPEMEADKYYQVTQSFFFKAGYVIRF